ncbi:hypothetical protein CMV_008240 [Castanea mollissima]|uniref:Post-GPI attachment to proteins factor 3 n=1 Tax=Castanea mollissima TaxID=60419 RepID=A0A8J4RCJ5_9ROSI|nr:hypothetical protein CMV_008240 [Castanea mollissima]
MAMRTLGTAGVQIACWSYIFIHYALLVAYVAHSSDVLTNFLGIPLWESATLFSLIFGCICYFGREHGWVSFFILLYYKLPLRPDKRTYYEYTGLWHISGILSMNSWFWSAVFHSRKLMLLFQLVLAGDTEFAKDATFGYKASNLREWVEDKTCGRIPASKVTSISIQLLRKGGPDAIFERLCNLPKVSKHSSFQESQCFYVVSTDGRKEDFSYRKCLDSFIKGKYPDVAETFRRRTILQRKLRMKIGNVFSLLPARPQQNQN